MAGNATYDFSRGKGGATASPAPSRLSKGALFGLIALAVLLLLLGVGFIAYPYVSDYLNRVDQAQVSHHQQQVVADTSEDELAAEMARAQDFNERLMAGRVVVTDPFDPDNIAPSDEEYESVLNLAGDDVMGSIAIPRIDVDLPIYHGVEGDGMEHGVGHMPSTSLPIGGPSTHAVLAGHTGLPSARIFDALDQLDVGDWFVITVLGEDHAYVVTSTEVVLPEETQSLNVIEGKDLVTLVTCTPYGVNTHRLLVHAERCEVPAEWLEMNHTQALPPLVPASVATTPKFIFTIIGLVAAVVILVIGLIVIRRRRRKRGEALAAPASGDKPDDVPDLRAFADSGTAGADFSPAEGLPVSHPARAAGARAGRVMDLPVIPLEDGPVAGAAAAEPVAPAEPFAPASPEVGRHASRHFSPTGTDAPGADAPSRGRHFAKRDGADVPRPDAGGEGGEAPRRRGAHFKK